MCGAFGRRHAGAPGDRRVNGEEAMFEDYHSLTREGVMTRLLERALSEVHGRFKRDCQAVDDLDFLIMGVRRVLGACHASGREFIQSEQMSGREVARSTYFENLASERRRLLAESAEEALRASLSNFLRQAGVNHLGLFPELEGRPVFAADGHYIEHACHASRDEAGRQVAFGNIHATDLTTGLMFPVRAILAGHSMHPNEWALLKKSERKLRRKMSMSRQGWDSKQRPLVVYDRAGADANFMVDQFLSRNGFDMVTRAKENMRFEVLEKNAFDKTDTANAGTLADERVRLANGAVLRRVTYKCPENGERFEFITTNRELRPGVIAMIYMTRWRVEKVFDVCERKLGQDKAWSNAGNPRRQRPCQADFISMAYNIMLFVKTVTEVDGGATEEMVTAKREREFERREMAVVAHNAELEAKAKKRKAKRRPRGLRSMHPMLQKVAQQWHQMTLQFIRCFRNLFASETTLASSFQWYRKYSAAYL